MSDKIDLGPEDAASYLEAQVNQARYDLKENLLPALKHGQKERLLLAIAEYPQKEADFSDEQVEMIKAFSALKICFDANVAFGINMVIEEMRVQRMGQLPDGDENGNQ